MLKKKSHSVSKWHPDKRLCKQIMRRIHVKEFLEEKINTTKLSVFYLCAICIAFVKF